MLPLLSLPPIEDFSIPVNMVSGEYKRKNGSTFPGCIWISNNFFEGYTKNNMPFTGRGTFQFVNNDYITYGEWANGKIQNGIGVYSYTVYSQTERKYFMGGWKDGKRSGIMFHFNLNEIYADNQPIISETILTWSYKEIINNTIIMESVTMTNSDKLDDIYDYCKITYLQDPKYRAY